MIRSLRLSAALAFIFVGSAGAQSAVTSSSASSLGGPGFGIDMNSMSAQLAAGLQVLVPFCRLFAIDARPMLLGANGDLDFGGRLELQLRSPVYLDRFRVYFAAGPQGFTQVRGRELHQRDFSGGWDTGMEVFMNSHFAVHWEMGTSGGGVVAAAGPAFSVGFRAYPWPHIGG